MVEVSTPLDRRGAGTLSVVQGIGRQADYWWTYYKRTWKGSIVSSFLSPLLYVLAMGVLLGGFVKADPAQLDGATSYLAFIVPGLIAAQAMTTGVAETTYPSSSPWPSVTMPMVREECGDKGP